MVLQLMIEHQEEIQGFNRSEAILILFPYIFKEQSRAMKWFQAQYLYHKATSEDNATASRALYSISIVKLNNQRHTCQHWLLMANMIH